MKKLIFGLLAIAVVFAISCKKDVESYDNSNFTNEKAMRLNSELSNEEMEEQITSFIEKLEYPETQPSMNYEEAFDYIEATLNYKYVDYDYSKCADIQTFYGSLSINPDGEGMMTMSAISQIYDSIVSNWRVNYYSLDESNKTPIVFDITEIRSSSIEYIMVVGYGSLELSYWANPTPPPSGVYFKQAAQNYTNGMTAQINNDQISRCPSGARAYYVSLGGQLVSDPRNYPSGSLDISLPNDDGYTDYLFFFSSADINYNNFHLYLSVPPQLDEYGFHATQLGNYVTNYAATHGGNRVTLCDVGWNELKDAYNVVQEARHTVNFYFGKEYYTQTSLSTL
jgi:hypothetical protein